MRVAGALMSGHGKNVHQGASHMHGRGRTGNKRLCQCVQGVVEVGPGQWEALLSGNMPPGVDRCAIWQLHAPCSCWERGRWQRVLERKAVASHVESYLNWRTAVVLQIRGHL